MWLYVLHDNQMKTNCNSSSKKKSAHTGPIRIGCERTLKPTHVISQKITLIKGGLNDELSCIYSSPSFKIRLFKNLVIFI